MARNSPHAGDIDVSVEVTGSFADALKAMSAKMSKEVIQSSLQAGTTILAKSLASFTPVDTGELRNHINVTTKTNTHGGVGTVGFEAGSIWASIGYWVDHGHASREARSMMQRFFKQQGTTTGHVPAHPFFAVAFDAAIGEASAAMLEVLQTSTATEAAEKIA